MGMYTELYLTCEFKKELPEDVTAILQYMFSDGEQPETTPEHPFFECDRWSMVGQCSSYYFAPMATSELYNDGRVTGQYYLTTRSDLKNYGGEIDAFVDWVSPYLDQCEGDHLGHKRYEEDDKPTLIYFKEGRGQFEIPPSP